MKHDLPGVGENLQDHIAVRMIHRCVNGTVTLNEIYHNWLRRLYAGAEWMVAGKGPLMTGAGPIGLFVKTRPELDSPDVQFQFLAGSAEKTGKPMRGFPGCTTIAVPCRPDFLPPKSTVNITGMAESFPTHRYNGCSTRGRGKICSLFRLTFGTPPASCQRI